jgi:hypothetical protein
MSMTSTFFSVPDYGVNPVKFVFHHKKECVNKIALSTFASTNSTRCQLCARVHPKMALLRNMPEAGELLRQSATGRQPCGVSCAP